MTWMEDVPCDKPSYHFFKYNDCGHVRASTFGHFQKGAPPCPDCYEERLIQDAKDSGLYTYVGKYPKCGVKREYIFNDCGHTKLSYPKSILAKNLQCIICREDRYAQEAADVGLDYVSLAPDAKCDYRLYALPCGCIRTLRTGHVKVNNWACMNCDDTYYKKPSNVYLIRIVQGDFSWLKLGVARSVLGRSKNYKLKDPYSIEELASVRFETASEAFLFERAIHNKYKEKRYNPIEMKVHMSNGHTECYPLKIEEALISEITTR